MTKVFKRCSCGRAYTEAQWKTLPFVGIQKYPWGEVQELRNCVCKSTMTIVLDPGEPEEDGIPMKDDLDGIKLPAWIRT